MDLKSRPLYTFQFALLCLSHVLFAGSFTMIIPELPNYLTQLGGAEYKGLIISLFTLTAGISRPFSGRLTDTVGRVPVMIIGALVCVVCSLFYPLLTSVSGFLLLRLLHGFSTGFKPTASTAYVADIVPVHRRGEAMGILGISMNIGASMAPPLGSFLAQAFSMDVMFYASSGLALISVLILFRMKETLKDRQAFRPGLLRISRDQILDKEAIPPSIITLLVYLSFGVVLTISPDQSEYLGLTNKGFFFTSFTFCSLFSRFVAGKVSDKYGRVPVIKVATVLVAISMVLIGLSHTPLWLLTASGALGFSTGIAAPAVFAWAVDRSSEAHRGRAMATIYIALEIGIGLGALGSGWIYANDPHNFGHTYFAAAAITLLAFFYLQFGYKKRIEDPI